MTINEQLTDLFSRLEHAGKQARVSFADGSVYDLRIISVRHAEAGGDIVADVVHTVQSDCAEPWETAAMNFKRDDVFRVEVGDECLFTRVDG